NPLSLTALRELAGDLGFTNAATLLQSGNLIFDSDEASGLAIENLFEKETDRRLGLSIAYIVRSAAEWQNMIARNPFGTEAKNDPGHLVVMFLKTTPTAKDVAVLQAPSKGPEIIQRDGKHLYIVYPDGIGRSKLTGTLIEQKLGAR